MQTLVIVIIGIAPLTIVIVIVSENESESDNASETVNENENESASVNATDNVGRPSPPVPGEQTRRLDRLHLHVNETVTHPTKYTLHTIWIYHDNYWGKGNVDMTMAEIG